MICIKLLYEKIIIRIIGGKIGKKIGRIIGLNLGTILVLSKNQNIELFLIQIITKK